MPDRLESYEQRRAAVMPRVHRDTMDNARSEQTQKIHSGSRWTRCSARVRALFPLCPDPWNAHPDRPTPSQEVHHIIPLHCNPDLAYVPGNLIALCRSCHQRADNMDRTNPIKQRLTMMNLINRRKT